MYSYLVSYSRCVPTGRFFSSWHWRPFDIVIQMPQLVKTPEDVAELKRRIAKDISTDHDSKFGRGVEMEHWAFLFFQEEADVAKGITINSFQPLAPDPSETN